MDGIQHCCMHYPFLQSVVSQLALFIMAVSLLGMLLEKQSPKTMMSVLHLMVTGISYGQLIIELVTLLME